jgi:hypothetical protein
VLTPLGVLHLGLRVLAGRCATTGALSMVTALVGAESTRVLCRGRACGHGATLVAEPRAAFAPRPRPVQLLGQPHVAGHHVTRAVALGRFESQHCADLKFCYDLFNS